MLLSQEAKATNLVTPKSKVPHFGLYNHIGWTLCPQSSSELPAICTTNDLRSQYYTECTSSEDPRGKIHGWGKAVKPVNFLLKDTESHGGGHEHRAEGERGNLHLSPPLSGSSHISNKGLGLENI